MNRDEALVLLRLDKDADLASAETVYENLRVNISRRLQELPAESHYHVELEVALEKFKAAIQVLREETASLEAEYVKAADPVIHPTKQGPLADKSTADQRVPQDEGGELNEPFPTGRNPAGESNVDTNQVGIGLVYSTIKNMLPQSSRTKLQALVGLMILTIMVLSIILVMRNDTAPTSSPQKPIIAEHSTQDSMLIQPQTGRPEPGDDAVDHQENVEQLDRELREAGDQLMDRQVELDQILEDATAALTTPGLEPQAFFLADERLQLIQENVVSDDYLAQLDHALDQSLASNKASMSLQQALVELDRLGADVDSRLKQFEELEAALTARAAVAAQVEHLQSSGISDWPPERSAMENLFEDMTVQQLDQIIAVTAAADGDLAGGEFAQAASKYRQAEIAISRLELMPVIITPDTEMLIKELYALGILAIRELHLSEPIEGSALNYAKEIEEIESGRPEAADLIGLVRQEYLTLARKSLDRDQVKKAQLYANSARSLGDSSRQVDNLLNDISARERVLLEEQFRPMRAVEEVAGIAMITPPLGTFDMGSSAKESAFSNIWGGVGNLIQNIGGTQTTTELPREIHEKPVHPVTIDSWFAISRSEITVGQFRRFVEATNYVTDAEKRGFSNTYFNDVDIELEGRNWRHDYLGTNASDSLPVTNVSFRDATAFANWLSELSGASYRLPSESEYEYAARAGAVGLAPWGEEAPPPNSGNFRGDRDEAPSLWSGRKGRKAVKTVANYGDGAFGPAESENYASNSFGIKNLLGNVSEWVADCYTVDYEGKGTTQHAVQKTDCKYRIVRGGDWATDARELRFTHRMVQSDVYSSNRIGFRVARDVLKTNDSR